MKDIAWYLLGAVLLGLLGAGLWRTATLERDLARAEEAIASQSYAGADASFAAAERYLSLASYVPGVNREALNAVRVRRAALHYWQHEYGAIAPDQPNPTAGAAADNVDLQFVLANAVFRSRAAQARDLRTAVQALDAGINAYLTVLKNASRHDDAAYNVEYLARLRSAVEGGDPTGLASGDPDPMGSRGILTDKKPDNENFKIYTPKTSDERRKAGDAGKLPPRKRQG